ncbi:hypothetical protein M8J75_010243 [Diaphorina citri]|nr:hypothetical protein M8J75_010243 [Diaphorina citri]
MRMRRLVLAILIISTTVIISNADQNGQWKGYTNLVSYSYGPPSGQVTPRRQIKIRMATESVKLECFTGQNSIPIVWRKQICDDSFKGHLLQPTILAEGTVNFFPDLYELEVTSSANNITSRLIIGNASSATTHGIFICQTSFQNQDRFLIGNEESLHSCLFRRHDERESKYMPSANVKYGAPDQYSTSNRQWYNAASNYNTRESTYTYYPSKPRYNLNPHDHTYHSKQYTTFSPTSYIQVAPHNIQDSLQETVPTGEIDSYFPIRDSYESSGGPYPNSVSQNYFKPSIEYPYPELVKPIDTNVSNTTQDGSNISNITTNSNITNERPSIIGNEIKNKTTSENEMMSSVPKPNKPSTTSIESTTEKSLKNSTIPLKPNITEPIGNEMKNKTSEVKMSSTPKPNNKAQTTTAGSTKTTMKPLLQPVSSVNPDTTMNSTQIVPSQTKPRIKPVLSEEKEIDSKGQTDIKGMLMNASDLNPEKVNVATQINITKEKDSLPEFNNPIKETEEKILINANDLNNLQSVKVTTQMNNSKEKESLSEFKNPIKETEGNIIILINDLNSQSVKVTTQMNIIKKEKDDLPELKNPIKQTDDKSMTINANSSFSPNVEDTTQMTTVNMDVDRAKSNKTKVLDVKFQGYVNKSEHSYSNESIIVQEAENLNKLENLSTSIAHMKMKTKNNETIPSTTILDVKNNTQGKDNTVTSIKESGSSIQEFQNKLNDFLKKHMMKNKHNTKLSINNQSSVVEIVETNQPIYTSIISIPKYHTSSTPQNLTDGFRIKQNYSKVYFYPLNGNKYSKKYHF